MVKKLWAFRLFEAGAMNILFGQSGLGSYAWGLVALDTRKDDDSCSVHLYFDLEYEHHSRESIVESDLRTVFKSVEKLRLKTKQTS
jgi:hypothetical protein